MVNYVPVHDSQVKLRKDYIFERSRLQFTENKISLILLGPVISVNYIFHVMQFYMYDAEAI